MSSPIQLPNFAAPLFEPYRYKVFYGGRGSAKSYSVARALLIRGSQKKRKILCAREFQNSINDSVLSLLEGQAQEIGLAPFYDFKRDAIYGANGTEFLFKGIRHNIQSIKSIPGITDCWIEEAQTISQLSWDIIIPTIREDGSEIFVTYNPENEDDPTHQKFVVNEPPPGSFVQKVNWDQNPWFPEVLRVEKDHQYATNPELAEHIWGGVCRSHSDAQIMKKKYMVDNFEPQPHWLGPYFGADFGFSRDAATLIKLYIDPTEMNLYIHKEFWGVGVDIDVLPTKYDMIPGSRMHQIRGDCSRPETISYLAKKGFNIVGAEKWTGSVEDGIDFIRSFNKVIIHPDCPKTKEEFKNYSFRVDRLTQEVTRDIVDAWNHCIDAIRYALQPMIRKNNSIFELLKGTK